MEDTPNTLIKFAKAVYNIVDTPVVFFRGII